MATGIYGGSITLASVSDGSSGQTLYTWIRYADDSSGTNMSPTPLATTKYIGFAYNKTSPTASTNPSDYVWSEYVGQDGKTITYEIETTREKIYKFYSQTSQDIVFSPEQVEFRVYEIENNVSTLLNPVIDYDCDISIVGQTGDLAHLLNFLSRIKGRDSDGNIHFMILETFYKNSINKNVTFKVKKLFDYSVTTEDNTQTDVTIYNTLLNLLRNDNIYFLFKIFEYHAGSLSPASGDLLATKPLPLEFGTDDDMAKFALTANAIQMAVNNSKLTFDATYGLTVQNGGFRILGTDSDTPLMEYNLAGTALNIVGNGTFTGSIYANEGSFTGDVSADTLIAHNGDIGSFIIGEYGLYSKYGSVLVDDEYDTTDASIKLLGESGTIIANSISLGTGATIERYIQLGNARLWNPEDPQANGNLVEAGSVVLTDTGELQLGQIIVDGPNSNIYGQAFSIKPDRATFSNVNVSGKISTVIFEQNHMQSVGGAMMFKPSYKIEAWSDDVITLDEAFEGEVGNYVYLIGADGKPLGDTIYIEEIDDTQVTVSQSVNAETLVSLIDLGKNGDLIIGVNSNDSGTNLLKPRGFTIAELVVDETDVPTINDYGNPKVFIGDLDTAGINFMSDSFTKKGFGLFSENVYLTGSLTTRVSSDDGAIFAGINTLTGAQATKFDGDSGIEVDTSRIVFWAGSASTAERHIQQAPFQITEKGSIYASQGLFEGAILTRSRIQGSDIYAARIHGIGLDEEQNYGIAFYDANDGLVFYRGDIDDTSTTPTEVFAIGTNGLRKGQRYFVQVDSNTVILNADAINVPEYFTDKTDSYFIHIKNNQIFGSRIGDNDLEEIQTNLKFEESKFSIGLGRTGEDIVLDTIKLSLRSDLVEVSNSFMIGNQLRYEKHNQSGANGYNLYVE